MFGSGSDKNNPGNVQPAAAGAPPVIGPGTAMLGRDNPAPDGLPIPPPNTSITPTAPVPGDDTPHFLETGPAPGMPSTSGGGNAFLATGNGAPAIGTNNGALQMPAAMPPAIPDDLVKIKQQALQHLAPLIDKLDQPPEERFKTLMMMIQASDNSEYLDEAYEAANGIKDEKEKAQALLDVVNEINYFTQNQAGGEPKA